MSIKLPTQIIDESLDRLTEIIWWNRGLTKLDKSDIFSNFNEFIMKNLVERKGPYIEYVRKSKSSPVSLRDFLSSMNFDHQVIKAVAETLFDGDDSYSLYKHQVDAIEKIIIDDRDVILSVPTATGKTSLAIRLAKKFNGWLISADSKQVYKGMDIITGKDHPKEVKIEMVKVSWPKRTELWQMTVVVIVVSLIMAVFIGGVDLFLSKAVAFIIR